MGDTEFFIDVRDGADPELIDFLKQHGIRAKPHYSCGNGAVPAVRAPRAGPAPYILVAATAAELKTAIQAYADAKKKRFIIHSLTTGARVDATNYPAEQMMGVGMLDLGKFEPERPQA